MPILLIIKTISLLFIFDHLCWARLNGSLKLAPTSRLKAGLLQLNLAIFNYLNSFLFITSLEEQSALS